MDDKDLDRSFEVEPLNESLELVIPQEDFKCDTCGYTTRYKHNLKRHLKKHTDKDEAEAPMPAYICDQCGKNFQTKHGLKLHVNSKHEMLFKYTCSVCQRGFNVLWNYRGHLASHHRELHETCERCKSKFQYKRSLVRHQKTCHGQNDRSNYYCQTCKMSFKCRDTMVQHNQGMHGGKVFTCKDCGKTYRWRSSLAYHAEHGCTSK